jgi:hypothetical protein
MIIECSYCEAKVDATIIAQHVDPPDQQVGPMFQVSLLVCPNCKNALVAGQDESTFGPPNDGQWEDPVRVWPRPIKYLSPAIPELVRSSLDEANMCYNARAYKACAVMCGQSLEGMCRHFKTKSKILAQGLKELLDQGIIDKRLWAWSNALRDLRNIGAHATEIRVSKEEASDLVVFANAICEYVFVLSVQFKSFMDRQVKKKAEAP